MGYRPRSVPALLPLLVGLLALNGAVRLEVMGQLDGANATASATEHVSDLQAKIARAWGDLRAWPRTWKPNRPPPPAPRRARSPPPSNPPDVPMPPPQQPAPLVELQRPTVEPIKPSGSGSEGGAPREPSAEPVPEPAPAPEPAQVLEPEVTEDSAARRELGTQPSYACESWLNSQADATVEQGMLSEISGIALSRANPGVILVHEDSGQSPAIYILDFKGVMRGKLNLVGARNGDWEDMSIGSCGPNVVSITGSCIWIADIGDNSRTRKNPSMIRIQEPDLRSELEANRWFDLDVTPDIFRFRYADVPGDINSHNAEAMVLTKEGAPVIITKRTDGKARLFVFNLPMQRGAEVTTRYLGDIWVPQSVTGADLSPDGNYLVLETYKKMYELHLPGGDIKEAITAKLRELPAARGPQPEAVAFDPSRRRIWHISEKAHPMIYYMDCGGSA